MKKLNIARFVTGLLAASLIFNTVLAEGLLGLVSAIAGTSNNVASVTVDGVTTEYADLVTAWNAAKTAKTAEVTLLKDAETNVPLSVEKGEDITFNGGEYTFTYTGRDQNFSVIGGKLTLNSGKICTSHEYEYSYAVYISEGLLEINGGSYSAPTTALYVIDKTCDVRLRGGTFNITNTSNGKAISILYDKIINDLLANHGDRTTDEHYVYRVVKSDGELGDYYTSDKLNAKQTAKGESVTVVKCTHENQALAHMQECIYCSYAPDHHKYNESGVCTVCQETAVASTTIGGKTTYYESIEDAWLVAGKATDPAAINLLKDSEIKLPLELNNENADITLKSDTNRTITTSGTVISAQSGNLTIESGTFTGGGDKAIGISSGANVTFMGGTFTGSINKAIDISSGANVTFKGGTFKGNKYAIFAQNSRMSEFLGSDPDNDNYFAYYAVDENNNEKVIEDCLKALNVSGTVTVKKCNHEMDIVKLTDNGETHGNTCHGCGKIFDTSPHSWDSSLTCTGCSTKAAAKVGGKYYSSLAYAWDAAKSVDEATIKLLADAEIDIPWDIPQNKSITLDGGSHTITYKGNDNDQIFSARGSFVLKNCVINVDGDRKLKNIIYSESAAEITNCTISGSETGVDINDGDAKITNCTISGKIYGVYVNDGDVNIKDCDIVSGSTGVRINHFDSMTISGGSITSVYGVQQIYYMPYIKIVITGGCKIQNNSGQKYGTGLDLYSEAALENVSVTGFYITLKSTNCSIKNDLPKNCYFWDDSGNIIPVEDLPLYKFQGDINIHPCDHNGSIFTDNGDGTHTGVCEICGKDGTAEAHTYDSNGKCFICGSQTAILVDQEYYGSFFTNTLEDAFTHMSSNTVITLLDDITLKEDLPIAGGTYILDLNGHTISGENANIVCETTRLTVRTSKNGGEIKCDISGESTFTAKDNVKLGKISGRKISILSDDVYVKELDVPKTAELQGGQYGSVTVTAQDKTLVDVLYSDSTSSEYFAFYSSDNSAVDIIGKTSVQNVTVKPCTNHVNSYGDGEAYVHNKDTFTHNTFQCKYCAYRTSENCEFIEQAPVTAESQEKLETTAVCKCGAKLTYEISLPQNGYDYYGKPRKAYVRVKLSCGEDEIKNISENNVKCTYTDNLNAGLAKITVKIQDEVAFPDIMLSFRIKKAKPTIKWEDQSAIYTGKGVDVTDPAITLENKEEFNGKITYTYAAEDSDEFTDVKPVDVGVYKVKALVDPQDPNYETAEKTVKLTIGHKEGSFNISETEIDRTYGDPEFTIKYTDKIGDGKVTFKSSSSYVATVTDDGIVTIHHAGTSIITVTLEATQNYTGCIKTITLTVAKVKGTLDIEKEIKKKFGDPDFKISYNTNSDGRVFFDTSDTKVAYFSNGTFKVNGVGECTITATLEDTVNYTGCSVEIPLIVAKAKAPTIAPETHNYTYTLGGTGNICLSNKLLGDCGKKEYSFTTDDPQGLLSDVAVNMYEYLDFTVNKDKPVGTVGKINVTIKTTNYEDAVFTVIVKTVEKQTVQPRDTVKVDGNNVLTYGDPLSKLVLKSVDFVESGTRNVIPGTLAWENGDSTPAAGTKTAAWIFKPDDSEKYSEYSGTVAIDVNKATPHVTAPTADSVIFSSTLTLADVELNGGEASWTVGGKDVTIDGTWRWENTLASPTIGQNSYSVIFTPDDNNNYNIVKSDITLTVNKPENPENPDKPENPENPDKPENPDTPDTPSTTEQPFIKGDPGKTGWDVIRTAENTAGNGDVINIDMNGTTVVPGDVFDKIKGKDITLNFDMGDGISWIVSGKDVTSDNVANIDLGVKKGSKNIPVDVVNNVTGEHYSMQLSLAYDGEFGFTAVLSVNLGKSNAGYIASLYYYDSASGELELICKTPISKDGNADLRFTHASDYLIVIDEKSDDGTPDNTDDSKLDNESTPDNSENTDENPNTGDPNSLWIIIFSMLLSVAVIGILVAERKKHI